MKRNIVYVLLILIFALPGAAATGQTGNFFPIFSSDWHLKGQPVIFKRDNLFDHINGEAEIYFPYGFELLQSGTYVNRKNPELWIVADVYRMKSVLDAFGIYSNYRSPDYDFVKIGAEGFVSPSQALFYQDRYFVRIQVTGAAELDRETMTACARGVSGRLPSVFSQPAELDMFSVPGIVPKSERYIAKSLIGYDFFRRGLIADAVRGKDKFQVFVVSEDSPEQARKALANYTAYLGSEGKKPRVGQLQGRITVESEEPLYGKVYVEQSGRHLLGAVKIPDVSAALPVIDKMQRKLNAN